VLGVWWGRVACQRHGAGGSCGDRADSEALALVVDAERPIEVGAQFDAGVGIAAAAGARAEEEQPLLEADRVVVGDGAVELEAADRLHVSGRRRGAPRRLRLRGGAGEASIVAGEKSPQDALRVRERAGVLEAEFADEAILEGAKEAFDATFGLRGVGRDPADAEFVEGAAELGTVPVAAELLGQGERAALGLEEGMAISVDGGGDAVAAEEGTEEEEIAVRVLLGAKAGTDDAASGIIDRREQHEARAPGFEPRVLAAVHLDEEAGLGHAVPAATMAGWAAGVGAADPGLPEDEAHQGPGQVQPLAVGEQLREVMIIAAGIGSASEGADPLADGVRQPAGRGPTAIAMGQRGHPELAEPGEQPPDMAEGQAQKLSRLPGIECPVLDLRQHLRALLLLLGQGDRLPGHSPRVTDSRSR